MNGSQQYHISNYHCISVACDFYQTCIRNSVSHTYNTKHKFTPIVTVVDDNTFCDSYCSGHDSNLENKVAYLRKNLYTIE